MGIAHGCARITVAKQLLHLVERMPGINQKTGKGMSKIMYADALQAQLAA